MGFFKRPVLMRELIAACLLCSLSTFGIANWTCDRRHIPRQELIDAIDRLERITEQLEGGVTQNQTINMGDLDRQKLVHEALKLRAEERRDVQTERDVRGTALLHGGGHGRDSGGP